MNDENKLIAERRAKPDELRDQGNAYPNDFTPNATAAQLHERFINQDVEQLAEYEELFSVAGRMLAKRVMGKIAFVRILDRSGEIQYHTARVVSRRYFRSTQCKNGHQSGAYPILRVAYARMGSNLPTPI